MQAQCQPLARAFLRNIAKVKSLPLIFGRPLWAIGNQTGTHTAHLQAFGGRYIIWTAACMDCATKENSTYDYH